MARKPKVVPRQGTRERVYFLVTWLIDDNGDQVEGTANPVALTKSDKVAREALEVFKKHHNGQTTLVHAHNEERYLPGLLGQILSDEEPEPDSRKDEDVSSILDKVDLG